MPEPLSGEDAAQAPKGPDPAGLAAQGRVRPILIHPDPALRVICEPVGRLGWDEIARLAADLLATMYDAGGRGLAAPQIGEGWRIFVMDHGWKEGTPLPRVVMDPQIAPLGGEVGTMEEACLSIPGRPVSVTRPVTISMRCFDLTGTLQLLTLTGIEARIAQHETDHLDGRLILDAPKGPEDSDAR
ncbi:peptide deformylase [Paracoccus denitrificans]|uniref:Peptide deformylase n=1 Tax=Paracoccus denitrificans (strain Pd 1222) TaxID=318586 RepID=A1AZR4_PARDP|nr:peptide deformylase [Paracoccus denitrificans]ABL68758.1 Peptide deformylase [Paracoccus denitrificans PD1222]MBB4625516.1 peptide deformylase [Paracoccus denitrificans]MCU7427315.1 peptide deformylase [Paracoccus denitrificans]QAR26812.1 peptide deformylase [Paracoccus denitrificans]UFS64147.1 peptide deformylase [Paracoccus denitrificans]